MPSPIVKVCIVGLGDRAKRRLTSFLYEIADDLCDVVEEADAEAAILDIDNPQFDWAQHLNRNPDQPVVLLAKDRPDLEGMIWVPKPIMEVALIEALNWARSAVQSGDGVTRQQMTSDLSIAERRHRIEIDVDATAMHTGASDTQTLAEYFEIAGSLLQVVGSTFRQSETRLSPMLVEIAQVGRLAIYPEKDIAYCDFGIETLASTARGGSVAASCSVRELDVGESRLLLEELADASRFESIDLLWRLGVWSSGGRLPQGTDQAGRFYLRCWPNFTRLMEIPHALRIAALWVREPATFDFLGQTLGVTFQDLFIFYSAAHAIGLAGPARREEDYLLANELRDDQEQSRFNALVRRIGRHLGSGAE